MTENTHVMDARVLGRSGVRASVIGLGCNEFGRTLDARESARVIDAAIDAGITFFDTADIYGESEDFLGRALTGRRDRVVLATKFGKSLDIGVRKYGSPAPAWRNEAGLALGSPAYVRLAVESSLRRLRTDHLDVLLMHGPDPAVPFAETLGALRDLVDAGLLRAVGVSNFPAAALTDGIDVVQDEYNLLSRSAEKELIPATLAVGASFVPFFPLANGTLTGKYAAGRPPEPSSRLGRLMPHLMDTTDWKLVGDLQEFADRHGMTMVHLALAWLASRPGVGSVIAGATKVGQVTANAGAAAVTLTPGQLDTLDRLTA